jgi:N-hydroxyarylamine O-acetyltransferase
MSAAIETDMWNTSVLDVDAYLARIGLPRAEAPLEALHEAHVRAIPFENVDPLLGKTPDLELGALLFAAVLERLGYPVRRRLSRVQPHKSGPRTHMMLVVVHNGRDHLVDVGFGAGMMRPMPLEDGVVVSQAGWDHRLTRDGRLWTLSKRAGDDWEPQHAFDDQPQRLVDYELSNYYVATHPRSPFTAKLIVMRLDHGISRRLVGDVLTEEHADGRVETTPVTPDTLGETLRSLDLDLPAEVLERLVGKTQVALP